VSQDACGKRHDETSMLSCIVNLLLQTTYPQEEATAYDEKVLTVQEIVHLTHVPVFEGYIQIVLWYGSIIHLLGLSPGE